MNCVYPTRLLLSCFAFFGCARAEQQTTSIEPVCFEGRTLKIIVPENPLASVSLQIIPRDYATHFTEWNEEQQLEAYELMQKVVAIWKEKGINDYLVYGKDTDKTNKVFSWEIVPFSKSGWGFWNQFKVLWNITFGGSSLNSSERIRIAKDYEKDKKFFSKPLVKQIESTKEVATRVDAFCDKDVVKEQLVFEGREINVLYNIAPLTFGEGKLHFLLVSKTHRENFSELTPSEFAETQELTAKLINHYNEKGLHQSYIFNKAGHRAGQSVHHFHNHVVFTATKTQEIFGKFRVLKNMLFGASRLSKEEVKVKVEALQKELKSEL